MNIDLGTCGIMSWEVQYDWMNVCPVLDIAFMMNEKYNFTHEDIFEFIDKKWCAYYVNVQEGSDVFKYSATMYPAHSFYQTEDYITNVKDLSVLLDNKQDGENLGCIMPIRCRSAMQAAIEMRRQLCYASKDPKDYALVYFDSDVTAGKYLSSLSDKKESLEFSSSNFFLREYNDRIAYDYMTWKDRYVWKNLTMRFQELKGRQIGIKCNDPIKFLMGYNVDKVIKDNNYNNLVCTSLKVTTENSMPLFEATLTEILV